MTFPYLKEKYSCPGFYIDVPYEKTQSSIKYVANQLKELKHFLEDITEKLQKKRWKMPLQTAEKQRHILRASLICAKP